MHTYKILLIIFLTFSALNSKVAITPKFDCGRLGDRLLNYSKTKFLSYKYKIPMTMEQSQATQFVHFPLLERLDSIYEKPEEHFDSIIDIYSKVPPTHYKLPNSFDPSKYFHIPHFKEVYDSCDLESVLTWTPTAFDKKTKELKRW